ncbi:MAG TPA: Spy/CpxP family protein refolding chaperone [Xanthobacteraceae bacterium]|nr:Spy/CpxP family protein refolding chaperone [Xanthobacteraceae bacterium]
MRRRFLVLVAISVGLVALPPAPPTEARSLLGLLGLRIGGHHHAHRHYGRHQARWARAHTRVARASVRPADGELRAPADGGLRAAGAGGLGAAGVGGLRAAQGGEHAAPTMLRVSPYWPRAYDDLIGATFAFAASDKSQFWNHGFNDIFAGVLAPPEAGRSPGARRRAGSDGGRGVAASDACQAPDMSSDATDTTPNAEASGLGAALFKKIEQRLSPTPEQQANFGELRTALIKADQRINSGCWPPYTSASPPERLKAIADRLWALRQAMLILRTPLEKLYDSLSDAQKAQFNAKGAAAKITCTADVMGPTWPRDLIEQTVQPSADQRASLETLQFVSLQMGQAITYSCPSQPLVNPVERLDAAGDRLNTLLYANMIISRTFGNFYTSLTDEQKTNFRAIGRSLGQPGTNRRAADAATNPR